MLDLEIGGLRGVYGRFQVMEGDYDRIDPRNSYYVYVLWFQCIAYECRYHFSEKLYRNYQPVRYQDQYGRLVATKWVYDYGDAPSTLLWNVGIVQDGRLRASPRNAQPQLYRNQGTRKYVKLDYIVHADTKLKEYTAEIVVYRDQFSRLRRRRPIPIRSQEKQWLEEY